jgi:hypothetical protein
MSSSSLDRRTRPTSIGAKVLAVLAVAIAMIAGIFFFGRLADDDRAAMALTGGWFAVVLIAGYLLTARRPALRLPMAAGYAAVAIAAGVLLGLPMLGDDEVNEQVVTGTPASAERPPASGGGAAPARPKGNVQLATGRFGPIAHPGSGRAAIVELPGGERKLTLTDFETDNGPDLRVYLSTGDPADGDLGDHEDLGALKGNVGNQQYGVPKDIDLDEHSTVVIWCRAFSVLFARAPLARPA